MDIVVVLGKYLNDDGSMSQELIDRVELGVKTFLKTSSDLLVLSGGIANKQAGVAEADKMNEYVHLKGINNNRIVVENKSLTTVENALYVADIFKDKPVSTVYVVSTKYHFFREDGPKAHELFIKQFPNSKIVSVYED